MSGLVGFEKEYPRTHTQFIRGSKKLQRQSTKSHSLKKPAIMYRLQMLNRGIL